MKRITVPLTPEQRSTVLGFESDAPERRIGELSAHVISIASRACVLTGDNTDLPSGVRMGNGTHLDSQGVDLGYDAETGKHVFGRLHLAQNQMIGGNSMSWVSLETSLEGHPESSRELARFSQYDDGLLPSITLGENRHEYPFDGDLQVRSRTLPFVLPVLEAIVERVDIAFK